MGVENPGKAVVKLIESISQMADATNTLLETEGERMQKIDTLTQNYRGVSSGNRSYDTVKNVANLRMSIQHTLDKVKSLAQNVK